MQLYFKEKDSENIYVENVNKEIMSLEFEWFVVYL